MDCRLGTDIVAKPLTGAILSGFTWPQNAGRSTSQDRQRLVASRSVTILSGGGPTKHQHIRLRAAGNVLRNGQRLQIVGEHDAFGGGDLAV